MFEEIREIAMISLGAVSPLKEQHGIGVRVDVRYDDGCDDPRDAGRVIMTAQALQSLKYVLTVEEARLIAAALTVAAREAEEEIERREGIADQPQ